MSYSSSETPIREQSLASVPGLLKKNQTYCDIIGGDGLDRFPSPEDLGNDARASAADPLTETHTMAPRSESSA